MSTTQEQSALSLVKAVARIRIFLGIPQELSPYLFSSQQPDTRAVHLVSTPNAHDDHSSNKTVLSDNDQDKERAWIVSSLLKESSTSSSDEVIDYRSKPVGIALESVLRWVRSSRTAMPFSTIISLVDVITAWIASSSSPSPNRGIANSKEPQDILESMLITLATLLVAAYMDASTDDEEEELGSLVASVVGQMAAYASDASIPEPIRLLAIGVTSTLLDECFARFKSTEASFLFQETSPSPSPSVTLPKSPLLAYEKFLRLVTSEDVWDFLKSLSVAPGVNVDLVIKGSSPVATAAIHVFLSREIAIAIQDWQTTSGFVSCKTEESCRELEHRIIHDALAVHGTRLMALLVLYGKRLIPHPAKEGAREAGDSISEPHHHHKEIADEIQSRFGLDAALNENDLDEALSQLTPSHAAVGQSLSSFTNKTRYPVPATLADHGWLGMIVLRQILMEEAFWHASDDKPRLLQHAPYSPIYIIMGLFLLDARASKTHSDESAASSLGDYIYQRMHIGDMSSLDTMINIYLSIERQSKGKYNTLSFRGAAQRALVRLRAIVASTTISMHQLFGSIQKSTWISLGVDCHNAGFGVVPKSATFPHRDVEDPLILLEWLYQQARTLTDQKNSETLPLLWTIFDLLHPWHGSNRNQPNAASTDPEDINPHSVTHRYSDRSHLPWPLHFVLRSCCPEILVAGCVSWFRWSNAPRPFSSFPKALAEALDYGLETQVEASATRAIQSLFQIMIASKVYIVDQRTRAAAMTPAESGPTSSTNRALGLNLQSSLEGTVEEGEDTKMGGSASTENSGRVESDETSNNPYSSAALTATLAEMYRTWNDFVDEGHGRSVPKLAALFQTELAADTKLRSKKTAADARGIKRGPLAGVGSSGGNDSAAGSRTVGGGVGLSGGNKSAKAEVIKKLKSASISPFESSPLSSAGGSDGSATASGTKAITSKHGQQQQQQTPPLQLMSSSDILAQLKASSKGGFGGGALASGTAGTSNLSNMTQSAQQAKVSNPLWAPILGLSHVPQTMQGAGARHLMHIQLEVQRWMTLLAHVDGPTFSEHLTGLIKAVYPSDQKFLLDQVLVEFMAWEDSAQNETVEGVKQSLKESRYYFVPDDDSTHTLGVSKRRSGASRIVPFTTEWIVETVIGALVSMVIKPEEQPGYVEPGSHKWMESMVGPRLDWKQVLDAQTVVEARLSSLSSSASSLTISLKHGSSPLSSQLAGVRNESCFVYDLQRLAQEEGLALSTTKGNSGITSTPTNSSFASPTPGTGAPTRSGPGVAAAGAVNKKRRLRNLYNRRVSPFYATLLMFQRKWTTSGHASLTFLGLDEDATAMEGVSEAVTVPTVGDPTSAADAGDDVDNDDDESDEAMLRRAQQDEKRTLACQAPIRTLLVILLTLTKMNQAGALDAWIVDALSSTIDVVQDRYFEWAVEVLRMRSTTTTAVSSNSASTIATASSTISIGSNGMNINSNPFGRFMALEQGQAELLRLIPVLTAATGIGSAPLQRAYQRSAEYHQKKEMAMMLKEQAALRIKSAGLIEETSGVLPESMPTTIYWRQLVALVKST